MKRSGGLTRRLLLGGFPGLASAAVSAAIPLSGSLFLPEDEYAIWALVATLSTVFLLFDFGAPGLAAKLGAEQTASARAIAQVSMLTATPPVLLSTVAAAAWESYAQLAGLKAISPEETAFAFLLVGAAAALRSVGMVFAGVALGRRLYGKRAIILVGSAIATATFTFGLLIAEWGIWSLAWGLFGGGLVAFVLGVALSHTFDEDIAASGVAELVRVFLYSKGAVTMMGVAITQLDRWALGLIGDATLLSQYDITTRIIQIPKIGLLALLVGLVAEGATSGSVDTKRIWERSTSICLIAFVASQAVCVPLVLVVIGQSDATVGGIGLGLMIVGLVLAQAALTATIPATYLFTGQGRPQKELVYLVPMFVLVMLSYFAGIATKSGTALIFGWVASVAIMSIFYLVYSRRTLTAGQE